MAQRVAQDPHRVRLPVRTGDDACRPHGSPAADYRELHGRARDRVPELVLHSDLDGLGEGGAAGRRLVVAREDDNSRRRSRGRNRLEAHAHADPVGKGTPERLRLAGHGPERPHHGGAAVRVGRHFSGGDIPVPLEHPESDGYACGRLAQPVGGPNDKR